MQYHCVEIFSFDISHCLNKDVHMMPGVSFRLNFRGFKDVYIINKEVLDTSRHIRLDELGQNSVFIIYL
jgi:hypothetical protein